MKGLVLNEQGNRGLNPTCDSETCKFNRFKLSLPGGESLSQGEGGASLGRFSFRLRVPGVRCSHLSPAPTCPVGPSLLLGL